MEKKIEAYLSPFRVFVDMSAARYGDSRKDGVATQIGLWLRDLFNHVEYKPDVYVKIQPNAQEGVVKFRAKQRVCHARGGNLDDVVVYETKVAYSLRHVEMRKELFLEDFFKDVLLALEKKIVLEMSHYSLSEARSRSVANNDNGGFGPG